MSGLYDIGGYPLLINSTMPESFGAVGDGVTDDSSALQSAIDQKGLVVFGSGKTYKVTQTLRIGRDTILDFNGATINSTNKHLLYNFLSSDTFTKYDGNGSITLKNGTIIGGAISFGHGKNIRLENMIFINSLNDHFLEIAGCCNYVINGCRFIGMADVKTSVYEYINLDPCVRQAFPWLPAGSAFYDGTKNDGIEVMNCYFSLGTGDYAYGYNAFGVHGQFDQTTHHANISFTNNKLQGFTGCGIRLNDMSGVLVANNNIQVAGDGIMVGDVASVVDVTIIDNYIVSSNGDMIALISGMYTDLTVANNVHKGQNDMS